MHVKENSEEFAIIFSHFFFMNSSPIKLGQNRPKQTLNQCV